METIPRLTGHICEQMHKIHPLSFSQELNWFTDTPAMGREDVKHYFKHPDSRLSGMLNNANETDPK